MSTPQKEMQKKMVGALMALASFNSKLKEISDELNYSIQMNLISKSSLIKEDAILMHVHSRPKKQALPKKQEGESTDVTIPISMPQYENEYYGYAGVGDELASQNLDGQNSKLILVSQSTAIAAQKCLQQAVEDISTIQKLIESDSFHTELGMNKINKLIQQAEVNLKSNNKNIWDTAKGTPEPNFKKMVNKITNSISSFLSDLGGYIKHTFTSSQEKDKSIRDGLTTSNKDGKSGVSELFSIHINKMQQCKKEIESFVEDPYKINPKL